MLSAAKRMSITTQLTILIVGVCLSAVIGSSLIYKRSLDISQADAINTELELLAQSAALAGQVKISQAQKALTDGGGQTVATDRDQRIRAISGTGISWASAWNAGSGETAPLFGTSGQISPEILSRAQSELNRTKSSSTAFWDGADDIILARQVNSYQMVIAGLPVSDILTFDDRGPHALALATEYGRVIASLGSDQIAIPPQISQSDAQQPKDTIFATHPIPGIADQLVLVALTPRSGLSQGTNSGVSAAMLSAMALALALIGLGVASAYKLGHPIDRLAREIASAVAGNSDLPETKTDGSRTSALLTQGFRQLLSFQTDQKPTDDPTKVAHLALDQGARAITVLDLDGSILSCSQAMINLMRSHPDAFRTLQNRDDPQIMIGTPIFEHLKGGNSLRQAFKKTTGQAVSVDITLGKKRLHVDIHDLKAEDGSVVAKAVEWTDVEDTRLVEGLVDAINEHKATIEFDLNGNIVNANDNFVKTMGYSAQEIRGMNHKSLVPKHMQEAPEYKSHWSRLAKGEEVAGKFLRVTKDGREIWMEAAYNPIRDANGVPYRVIKIATDITEIESTAFDRKAVMDAISRAQSVLEMDAQGNILSINENFLALLQKTGADTNGSALSSLLTSDFVSSGHYDAMWTALQRGEADSRIYEFTKSDGAIVHLQGAITPVLDRNGHVFKFIACLADVTKTETDRQAQNLCEEQAALLQERVVEEMRRGLTALADGDLTVQIEKDLGPDYETLRHDFNDAISRLQDTMSRIVANAGGINNEASEIARAAEDLSRRTEGEAATLEQTSAALEQLTASVKSAAEGASKVSQNVTDAQSSAEKSGAVVDAAIQAMSEIEGSSNQISQIIGVIEDIAFQTNLLALNAGVEAARAGDAGRGFAVVASEVRALAQRSSEAAKEIKTLISTSSEQVGSGVKLVGQTGKALSEILESVTSISGLVSDIANTAREQSVGIGEINTAVNEIDQVTQKNAAMVQQSTATSQALMQEADELAKAISHFRVSEKPAEAVCATPPTKPRKLAKPTLSGQLNSAPSKPVPPKMAAKPKTVIEQEPKPAEKTTLVKVAASTAGNTALNLDEEIEDWDEF